MVWAGAQPRDEDALDPEFLRRLDAILNLTDANGIAVLVFRFKFQLDNIYSFICIGTGDVGQPRRHGWFCRLRQWSA